MSEPINTDGPGSERQQEEWPMQDERRQILQMVADGKITPEEAGKLLDALDLPADRTRVASPPQPGSPFAGPAGMPPPGAPFAGGPFQSGEAGPWMGHTAVHTAHHSGHAGGFSFQFGTPPPGAPAGAPHVVQIPPPAPAPPTPPRAMRHLIIQVQEDGEQRVNVQVPLSLARTAMNLLPPQARRELEKYEINLDQLIAELTSSEGRGIVVQVQDENENGVQILVD